VPMMDFLTVPRFSLYIWDDSDYASSSDVGVPFGLKSVII
jgi:hypothetical protein